MLKAGSQMRWLGILGVAGIAIYVLLHHLYPSATYRYRLTIFAEASGKPVSGSGVVEVTHENRIPWMANSSSILASTTRGEAFFVDFGSSGRMLVLLRGDHRCSLPDQLIPHSFDVKRGLSDRDYLNRLKRVEGIQSLSRKCLPRFVRFRDQSDPTSVDEIDPDDLSSHFGQSARFTGATVEITRDKVTTGIEAALPWIKSMNNKAIRQNGRNGAYRILPTDLKRML